MPTFSKYCLSISESVVDNSFLRRFSHLGARLTQTLGLSIDRSALDAKGMILTIDKNACVMANKEDNRETGKGEKETEGEEWREDG